MTIETKLKDHREYAWNYFQLHANQRMTTFNFFVVIATLLSAGLAGTFKKDYEYEFIGVVLGLDMAIISFVFWKLDQRVRYLIKHAESALKEIERQSVIVTHQDVNQNVSLFSSEEKKTADIRSQHGWLPWRRHMSYSECFGSVYFVFGILGALGTAASIIRWVA
ncbi:hypothetical protein ACFL5B_01265 [Candidatus Latescibacterota bacterium]